ncbi:Uncharacterised protein [Shigella sonnei]|nr:Uncharacterised protein [Shigella sonnei]
MQQRINLQALCGEHSPLRLPHLFVIGTGQVLRGEKFPGAGFAQLARHIHGRNQCLSIVFFHLADKAQVVPSHQGTGQG